MLILLEVDAEKDEETLWVDALSKKPAFEFLHDSSEDIYSINDGGPFND